MNNKLTTVLPFKVKICESNSGSGLMKVSGVFQKYDVVNANGRVYPKSLFERILKDEKFKSKLTERAMTGVLEHPEDGQTKIDHISHVVTKVWDDNKGNIMGEAEILGTPAGDILKALFEGNVMVGISSRGTGSINSKDGVSYVNEDYILETWDFVYNNSVPGANPVPVAESSSSVKESNLGNQNIPSEENPMSKLQEMKKLRKDVAALCNESFSGKSADERTDLIDRAFDYQVQISGLIESDASLAGIAAGPQKDLTDFVTKVEESEGAELAAANGKYDALKKVTEGIVEKHKSLQEHAIELGSKLQEFEDLGGAPGDEDVSAKYDALKTIAEELVTRLVSTNKVAESAMKKLKESNDSGATKELDAAKKLIEALIGRYHGDTKRLFIESLNLRYPESKEAFAGLADAKTFTESVTQAKGIVAKINEADGVKQPEDAKKKDQVDADEDHSGEEAATGKGGEKKTALKCESTTPKRRRRREPLPTDKLNEGKDVSVKGQEDALHESVSLVRRARGRKNR